MLSNCDHRVGVKKPACLAASMFANVKFSAPEPINLKRNGVIDEADLLIS